MIAPASSLPPHLQQSGSVQSPFATTYSSHSPAPLTAGMGSATLTSVRSNTGSTLGLGLGQSHAAYATPTFGAHLHHNLATTPKMTHQSASALHMASLHNSMALNSIPNPTAMTSSTPHPTAAKTEFDTLSTPPWLAKQTSLPQPFNLNSRSFSISSQSQSQLQSHSLSHPHPHTNSVGGLSLGLTGGHSLSQGYSGVSSLQIHPHHLTSTSSLSHYAPSSMTIPMHMSPSNHARLSMNHALPMSMSIFQHKAQSTPPIQQFAMPQSLTPNFAPSSHLHASKVRTPGLHGISAAANVATRPHTVSQLMNAKSTAADISSKPVSNQSTCSQPSGHQRSNSASTSVAAAARSELEIALTLSPMMETMHVQKSNPSSQPELTASNAKTMHRSTATAPPTQTRHETDSFLSL